MTFFSKMNDGYIHREKALAPILEAIDKVHRVVSTVGATSVSESIYVTDLYKTIRTAPNEAVEEMLHRIFPTGSIASPVVYGHREDEDLEISDADLERMMKTMRPVFKKENEVWHMKPICPRTKAFMWDPVPDEEATDIVEYAKIHTVHEYGYFFKPDIAEVLAQIKSEEGYCVAFTTIHTPEMYTCSQGRHLGITTLYKKRES